MADKKKRGGAEREVVGRWPGPERLLELLRESVDEVFGTMLATVAVLVECRQGSAEIPDEIEDVVDIEAVVEFKGSCCGAVVLRCSTAGATDIAREFLMLSENEAIELEEIQDALGECANMVTGTLKSRAFESSEDLGLGIPKISSYTHEDSIRRCGTLVYRLHKGCVAIEVWVDQPDRVTEALSGPGPGVGRKDPGGTP